MKKILNIVVFLSVILAVSLAAQPVSAEVTVTRTDLATLGGSNSFAYGINNQGQIAGSSTTIEGITHAISWNGSGAITDLGAGEPYGTGSPGFATASAINDLGQIVGDMITYEGGAAVLWDENGRPTHISVRSKAYDINNSGYVVGDSHGGIGLWAFLWNINSGRQSLEIQNSWSVASGINDLGMAVGGALYANPVGEWHAVHWGEDGLPTYLETPVGSSSYAIDINNNGEVVGFYIVGGEMKAVRWDANGNMTDLGINGAAVGINDRGQIVGGCGLLMYYFIDKNTCTGSAFFWDKGIKTDLVAPGINAYAFDINDNGQIVGSIITDTGAQATLWKVSYPPPMPEEQVQKITTGIQDLVNSGALNQGQGNALTAKLDAATQRLNEGDKNAAANVLRSFINQIQALIDAGKLSDEEVVEAQELIKLANDAISQLGG